MFGGIELLLALGFKMKVIVSANTNEQGTSSPSNSKIDAILNSGTFEHPIDNLIDILNLLTPNTIWDCLLEMDEPAITASLTNIAGKDDWVTWFDKLNSDREIISNFLKTLS